MSQATIAALWSAVAASFSALAAVVAMLIQRRNLLESVRPELVLVGWGRLSRGEGDAAHEVITIASIKNVGRGAALHMHLDSMYMIDNRPVAVLSTTRLPILAPNESAELGGEIILWWKNAQSASDKMKFIPINIRIYAWDSRGMRHETKYSLFALELGLSGSVSDAIAPGLALTSRVTITKPVWMLKLRGRLARVPLLGAVFREKQQ